MSLVMLKIKPGKPSTVLRYDTVYMWLQLKSQGKLLQFLRIQFLWCLFSSSRQIFADLFGRKT